jgi:hypothetical protein
MTGRPDFLLGRREAGIVICPCSSRVIIRTGASWKGLRSSGAAEPRAKRRARAIEAGGYFPLITVGAVPTSVASPDRERADQQSPV